MDRAAAITLLAAAATGCGGKLALLRTQAAADMTCSEDQIEASDVAPYVVRAAGCGKENVYFYSGSQERWVSPLERATFDLDCPREELATQALGSLDVGVSGCGKKIVYVFGMSGWVANTEQHQASPDQQTASPTSAKEE
jgi:hypothetical protein